MTLSLRHDPSPDRIPWPPPPLTMGSRIYHWGLSHGQILDVVCTHNYGQFQVQVDGEPDVKVWKREELRSAPGSPGDRIEIMSLSERAVTSRWTYVGFINLTRGGFVPLHFQVHAWGNGVQYAQRPEYFGVRTQRAADRLLERYFYELCFNAMRLCGESEDAARAFADEHAKDAAKYHSRCWKRHW